MGKHMGRPVAAGAAIALSLACAAPATAGAEASSVVDWAHLFGDAGSSTVSTMCDSVNQTQRLSDGGFVAAATFDAPSGSTQEHAKGKADAVLVRYDADGGELWRGWVEGEKADLFNGVTEADDGGFVAVGATQSTKFDLEGKSRGGQDGLLAKFDAQGNLVKTATFGGSGKDVLQRITPAVDGGFIVVGSSASTDGDMQATGKTETDTDAVIAKYDDDLNLVWVTRVGGTKMEGQSLQSDEFSAVVQMQDATALDDMGNSVSVSAGYLAVGKTNANNGDLEGQNKGDNDVLVSKIAADGSVEWTKSYGGAGKDEAASVSRVISTMSSADEGHGTIDNGFIIAGTTKSADGDFGVRDAADSDSAGFVMRIGATGNVIWSNLIEDSEAVTADGVVTTLDGYIVAGTHETADNDFTGTQTFGRKDAYAAHFSTDGARLGIETFGGNDHDTVKGLSASGTDDVLVCGTTRSDDGIFAGRAGKIDGFVASLNAEKLTTHAEETTLVPVSALHATKDEASMMAPMLYADAYVQRMGEQYTVTVYFQRATIMGSEVTPSFLGDVTYDRGDGVMVDALSDSYDPSTRVKTTTIQVKSLDKPIHIHIDNAMGDVRLSFDPANARVTDTPPYFAPVEVTLPDFPYTWKTTFGGSSAEYAADSTVLADGTLATVGQTYSFDGDVEGLQRGPSNAYVNIRDAAGNSLKTIELGGLENNYTAYAASVDATTDGGFYLCGGFTTADGTPKGDFASLDRDGAVFGQTDAFVTRFSADGTVAWMRGLTGSGHDQAKAVKATLDGGCVALFETSSHDGDLTDLNRGIFNLVVVKYDASGNTEWTRTIGGRNLESSDFGIDILANGNYVVAGIKSSCTEDFADAPYYGNTFDLFATEISAADGTSVWLNTYGGESNEYFNGVTATSDGGFIMLGKTKSSTDTFAGFSGYENSYIMKLGATGQVEWVDGLKSSGSNESERAVELDDRYVVIGNSNGTDFDFKDLNKGSSDVYVAQYDKAGKRLSLDVVGGSAGDYAAQITAVNGYQLNLLMYGDSNDGDFAGLSKGDSDTLLLTYDWREAAGDPSALAALAAQAAQLSQADWTPDSWRILTAKLEAANTLLTAPYATKAQYDQAAAELQLAMDGLAKVADRTSLEAAIEQAGALANDGWTADSWNALQAKIAAGKALLQDAAASQEQIDQAEKGIRDAMGALKKADVEGDGSAAGDDQDSGGEGDDNGIDQEQGGTGQTGDDASKGASVPAGSGNASTAKAGASTGLATTGDAAGAVAGAAGVAAIVAAATALGARLKRRALKGRR